MITVLILLAIAALVFVLIRPILGTIAVLFALLVMALIGIASPFMWISDRFFGTRLVTTRYYRS